MRVSRNGCCTPYLPSATNGSYALLVAALLLLYQVLNELKESLSENKSISEEIGEVATFL